MIVEVTNIEYSDTETESSSGYDSPPEAKRPCLELIGASCDRYLNALERKIIKLMFSVTNPEYHLSSSISKKSSLLNFITRSELEPAEDILNKFQHLKGIY